MLCKQEMPRPSKMLGRLLELCRSEALLCVSCCNFLYQISALSVLYTCPERPHLYYLASALYVMAWSLYFIWRTTTTGSPEADILGLLVLTLVGNGNTVAVYFSSRTDLAYATFVLLPLFQILIFLYSRPAFFYIRHLTTEKSAPLLLTLIKLDLVFGSCLYCDLLYYVFESWRSAVVPVCSSVSVAMLCLVVQSLWGWKAACSQRPKEITYFVLSIPAAIGVKLFFFLMISLTPGNPAQTLLYIHTVITGRTYVASTNVLVLLFIGLVSVLLERHLRLSALRALHELTLVPKYHTLE